MNSELIANRFQLLSTLVEGDVVGLHLARDVAREQNVWLLVAKGAQFAGAESAVRYRLQFFDSYACFRSFEILDSVFDANRLCVALQAREEAALAEWPPRAKPGDALVAALEELGKTGLHAGALAREHLYADDAGLFFLPTAYALAPVACGFTDLPMTIAPRLSRREISSFLETFSQPSKQSSLVDSQDDVLPELDGDPSGALILGAAALSTESVELLAEKCEASQRRLWVVGEHWCSPSQDPRGANPPGVVLYLGLRNYATAAESVANLRKLGWIDGHESVVVACELRPSEKAATLALAGLSHRLGDRWSEFEGESKSEGESTPSVTDALAMRVGQLLYVAQRPLPLEILQRVLHCTMDELAESIVILERAGWARTIYGRPDEISGLGTLVVELLVGATAVELDSDRAGELQALLDATLSAHRGRASLGRSWISLAAQLRAGDGAAVSSAHRLAERANRAQLPLLEFAVHELLLENEADIALSASDRCQAAVSMGEQLRVHGEVAAAETIFEAALAEFRTGSGQEAAALVSDIVRRYSDLLEHQARFEDIHRLLEEVLRRYGDRVGPEQRGRLYIQHARALRHLGRFPESVARAELALKLFDPERFPRELSEIYTNLGLTHWAQSDYSGARDAYRRGLQLAEEAGDEFGAARLWNNLGLAYRAGGEFAKAEEALSCSAEIKARIEDLKGLAATQLNLGFVQLDRGDHVQAKQSAEQCLDLARKLQQGELEAQAYGLMGECARDAGEMAAAEAYFLEDLRLSDANGMRNERLATLRRLVDLLLRVGRLNDAARRLEEARSSVPDSGSRLEPALLELLEARLLRSTGAGEPALDLYGSAAAKLGNLRRRDLQLDALIERGSLQVALSKLAAARRTLHSIREIQGTQSETRRAEELLELEAAVARIEESEEISLLEPATVLAAVGELVRRAEAGENEAAEAVTKIACEALGAVKAQWIDTEHDRATTRDPSGLGRAGISSAVREALADLDPSSSHRRHAEFDVINSLRVGRHLVLWRDAALEASEIELAETIANIAGLASRENVVETEQPPRAPSTGDHGIIGESAGMRDVLRQIDLMKNNDITVLLLGANGTGKDLVAQAIHRAGRRSAAPFHAVNCAAIPHSLLESELFGHERGAFTGAHQRHPGLFERAHRGTLFLDEIGEMDPAMQAKLLRVLQDQSFTRVGGTETIRSDVRVLAATNRDLASDVERGDFRMDLYYRLNVVSIEIPALRERSEDIGLLTHHFIERLAPEFESPVRRITQEAVARLAAYDWPGNVRELENVIKNAMVFAEGDRIRVEDLPAHVLGRHMQRRGGGLEGAVREVVDAEELSMERPLMPRLELLLAHEVVRATGNKTLAAKILGITKPTLYARLRRFDALYGGRSSTGAAGSDR